jgi:serine/threonine protein kinase
VSPRIRIKIGGLCLVKCFGRDDCHALHGTWEYTAPEVHDRSFSDERETDRYTSAVDIWSFGCVAYTILTNELPFPGFNHLMWYVAGQKGFPTALLVENNISEPAQKLLQRMLAPAPHNRPTAKECLEDAWITTGRAHKGHSRESSRGGMPSGTSSRTLSEAPQERKSTSFEVSSRGVPRVVLDPGINSASTPRTPSGTPSVNPPAYNRPDADMDSRNITNTGDESLRVDVNHVAGERRLERGCWCWIC